MLPRTPRNFASRTSRASTRTSRPSGWCQLPLTAKCKEELVSADLVGDDYIEHIPVTRAELDGLASGKKGLMVSSPAST